MQNQRTFYQRYARDVKPGTLTWIGLRPARKETMVEVSQAYALAGLGLQGDHRAEKTAGSGRQITLISEEFIAQIAHFTGRQELAPSLLRRNLVVKGINLNAIRHQQFMIGGALFEATALCHPCSRMEQALGKGGVSAMLGYGGLCAKIIDSGTIRIGDTVSLDTEQGELFHANQDSFPRLPVP
mgnify:CR=1 FL=1